MAGLIPVTTADDPRLEPYRDIRERDLVGRQGLFVAEGKVVIEKLLAAGRLPLRSACVDMLWSNLAFQWVNDLPAVFAESQRVLRPGGLLMFTTFGPDTLKELRAACAADGKVHVNRFIDMHDIGDMMIGAGFADPVMDMEYVTLTYTDVRSVMRELKALGAHNVAVGRNRGLTGKQTLREIERRYESFRRAERLPATFEIIYGHAWKPFPRTGPGGRPVIDIKST